MLSPAAPRPIRYHLRVTITPQAPEAEAERMFEIVRRGRVDEVMFFLPHAEEMSPGLGTDAECREARDRVRPLFDRLRAMGVVPSVNIWWTKSFSNFGLAARDLRGRFDFRWAVGAAGQSDYASACPLDERWLGEAKRMYATFAELRPGAMWMDDDVQARLRGYIRGACFCPVCLERAAAYTGRPFDRTGLLDALLADPPNPVREGWLRFQNDMMLRIFSSLREAVHAVSPQTRMGVMLQQMEAHFAEGRTWGETMKAACGPHRVLARPHYGNYQQGMPNVMMRGINHARFAQAVAGPDDDLAPEVENYPHTLFLKSNRLTAAQMTISALLGMPEITFSIFRFGGRLDLDPAVEPLTQLLERARPKLEAIAELDIRADQHRGLGLFWHDQVATVARAATKGDPFIVLPRARPWDEFLPRLGFATRYGASDVTVFSGEAIVALGPTERAELLSRGALLDARAAAAVIARGEGDLIGMSGVLEPVDSVQELIEDGAFGGVKGEVLNTRFEGGKAAQFALLNGVRVISSMTTYGLFRSGHGMTLFTNRLGGRVAVFPFDGQISGGLKRFDRAGDVFFNPSLSRQRQLHDLFTWLAGQPPELFVPGAPNAMPFLSAQPRRLIVGVANFHSDAIQRVVLELRPPAFEVTRVRALTEAGRWADVRADIGRTPAGALRINTNEPLEHLEVGVFEVL